MEKFVILDDSYLNEMAALYKAAFSPLPYMNLYAATKAFVYSYSRALREELHETGIVVTTICPGWIKTALLSYAMFPGYSVIIQQAFQFAFGLIQ